MKTRICFRNDKGNVAATLFVEDGHIDEETMEGCWVADLETSKDGIPNYYVDFVVPQDDLSQLSCRTLLEEIACRCSD